MLEDYTENETAKLAALSELGLSIEDGLSYCSDDAEFYFEILGDFADSYDKKADHLDEIKASLDFDDYKLETHALKSTAKTIGAMELHKKAKALEKAATDKDTGFIEAHHADFIKEFEDTSRNILSIVSA